MRYLFHFARPRRGAGTLALLATLAAAASGCDDPVRTTPTPAPAPTPAAEVVLSAERSALDVGDTLALAAAVRDAQGNALTGREVAWTSSDTLVATVSAGVARARAAGRATITAAVGEAAGRLELTVEPRVDSIFLSSENRTTLLPGDSARLRVSSLAGLVDGQLRPVQRATRWSSSNPAAVVVSDSGVIRSVAPGRAVVTVTAGRASRQIPVAVVLPYTVTALEVPAGASAEAFDLNAAGEAVGTVTTPDSTLAVLWRGGRMTVLGRGAAYAVNDRGQVAGASDRVAVVWEGGVKREVYRRGYVARATAINRNGDVAGEWEETCQCRYNDGGAFAVIGGRAVDVVPVDPYKSPRVFGINDAGWVVGSLYNNRSHADAFLYRDGQLTNLEEARFGKGNTTYSEAAAVNNRGQVVGYAPSSEDWRDLQRAFLLEDARVTWLGSANPPPSGARDINDRGEIVGQVNGVNRPGPGALTNGVLWWAGGMTRLDWLLVGDEWVVRSGVAINERGQILAHGRNTRTGATVPIILTPSD